MKWPRPWNRVFLALDEFDDAVAASDAWLQSLIDS